MKLLLFLIYFFSNHCISQDILIKDINVVDVRNGKILSGRSVLISKGIIQKVSGKKIRARDASIINGRGKFIIPGLWDMHVHTADSNFLNMFINYGVTGIRDMGGAAHGAGDGCESIEMQKLLKWRTLIQSGLLTGPRMMISGPVVSNTGWPTSINIKTPDDARMAVKKLQDYGVDFIKVYEKISLDTYLTLAAEANAEGLTIAGHVPVETVSLIEAANAGQRSIEHVRDPLLMCFTDDKEELLRFFKEDDWSPSDIAWGLQQFEQSPYVISAFQRNNTFLVPTLVVEWAKIAAHNPLHVNDERRNYLPPSISEAYSNYVNGKLSMNAKDRKSDSLWWITQKLLVNRMNKEGIPLLAGTDCACQGGIPGFSLHRELELLVESGLKPIEALKTATINPAIFFNLTDSLGTIEKGRIADLVILNRNPLKDISATQSIFQVILNGRMLHRK